MTRAERGFVVVAALTAASPLAVLLVAAALRWPVVVGVLALWFLIVAVVGAVLLDRRLSIWRAAGLDPQAGRLRVSAASAHPHTAGLVQPSPSRDSPLAPGTVQRLADLPLARLEAHAIHSGSPLALRALSLKVAATRLEPGRLVAVHRFADPERTAMLGDIDADAALALATALGAHREPVEGLAAAALDLVIAEGADRLAPARATEAARLCIENDRGRESGPLLKRAPGDWRRVLLAADLIDARSAPEAWQTVVGALYDGAGLEPPQLEPGQGSPFERLTVAAPAGSVRGPLVSVVMTVWRPGSATRAAVRSVLAQTWRDLELIIVDDASGTEFDAELAQLEALDERVRIVRAPVNGGTYRRRDDGVQAARGEFIAFHDGDDLSHPRRLEIQVGWMLRHAQEPGCVTTALRIGDDLRFSQPRGLDLRLCEPSIMLRSSLMPRLGSFPLVRKGGDVEFRERVGLVAGRPVQVIRTSAPLTLQRWDRSSLSGQDFASGWAHPARLAYRSAHSWSRRTGRPALPAPARLSGEPAATTRLEAVVIVDARLGSRSARALRRAHRALARAVRNGWSVGLMHSPAPLGGLQERDFVTAYHDLIALGAREVIAADDPLSADRALVLDSDALLGLSAECAVTADRVEVVDGVRAEFIVSQEIAEIARATLGALTWRPVTMGASLRDLD